MWTCVMSAPAHVSVRTATTWRTCTCPATRDWGPTSSGCLLAASYTGPNARCSYQRYSRQMAWLEIYANMAKLIIFIYWVHVLEFVTFFHCFCLFTAVHEIQKQQTLQQCLQLTDRQSVCLTIWNDAHNKRREFTLPYNVRHLGQSEDWIFCLSLVTPTWHNVLSRIYRSIRRHFNPSFVRLFCSMT